MANVLVVANRTAESPELLDALRGRAAQGEATFTLLVPATPHGVAWAADMHSGGSEAEEHMMGAVERIGLLVGHAARNGNHHRRVVPHRIQEATVGATDGGLDLGAGADDAGVVEHGRDLGFPEAGDSFGVEVLERGAEGVTLAQNDDPGHGAYRHHEEKKP